MQHFIRIKNDSITEYFITKIEDGFIHYGYYKPGHENRVATAVMTEEYFNKLRNKMHPEILFA